MIEKHTAAVLIIIGVFFCLMAISRKKNVDELPIIFVLALIGAISFITGIIAILWRIWQSI